MHRDVFLHKINSVIDIIDKIVAFFKQPKKETENKTPSLKLKKQILKLLYPVKITSTTIHPKPTRNKLKKQRKELP